MRLIIVFFAVLLYSSPLSIINEYRNAVGLNRLSENPSLSLAAKLHAKYLLKNGEFSHYEKKYGYRFAGITPQDRAISCGYASRYVLENLSKGDKTYSESIRNLFSAIYHRLAFLDFNINEIGYYRLEDIFVYDMGNSYIDEACKSDRRYNEGFANLCKDKNKIIPKSVYYENIKNNPKIIFWPYNSMKNIPTVFYEEHPDPLPGMGVSGYPISISFNPYYFKNKKIKLLSFELFKENEKINDTKIITVTNDVNHMIKKTQFVLFPLRRLDYGEKYRVEADFIIDGKIKSFEFYFETEEKKVPIITVVSNRGEFYIKPNVTYLIYFKPLDKNDKLSHLRYEFLRGMKINSIGYKDANTIYLNVSGAKNKKLKIYTKKRKITLIIKE